ncbi:MAG: DegT/DnrJ/EryC1/StrS family aminotransferase [Anaerolineae bacterium]
MPAAAERLAINGGPKSFDVDIAEFTNHPVMEREEIGAVVTLMTRNEISTSPLVRQFEREFADYHGAKYAIGQCNGTSTLHSAYFAVGVGPGDEVITPAYTWHLAVGPIMAAHGIPVFADIDRKSLCVLPEDIERKITDRTKAIAVLHAFGHPAPMDEIMAVARRHNLPVIEDASHAHGASYKGRLIGTWGDIGCFSLQGSKIMVGGEGGVLITDNKQYYERAIALGHYERISELGDSEYAKYAQNYPQPPACYGYKYRMHPLAAAIAREQFLKLDRFKAIERENMRYLTGKLTGLHPAFEPAYEAPDADRVWLNYIAYFDEDAVGIPRDRFVEALRAEGVDATAGRAGYLPLYWNPIYQDKDLWGKGCPFSCPHYGKDVSYPREGLCPNTEAIWKLTVGLPVFWNRTPTPVLDRLADAVAKVLGNLDELR